MIETGKFLQQRYKIDKQIGQGGMGAVYVATDERFGSTVAIKETLCMDDNFRKAIEREARLLNSLKHNALPRVSDHFEEDNGQFLVMEYIPGDDVATILEKQNAPFPVETVAKWADQLLDALDYLHNQTVPVIHRDIKPQNLKINARGDIILLDFGLAKGNPTDAGHQTAAKSIFGYSRNYASLEQIQGTGTDPRSDLYSLAATLYHLLTNVAPEDALTRAMSVLSQNGDTLRPACDVEGAVPRGLAGVLQKAMDLNAGQRPASAAEMRRMLGESENYEYLTDIGGAAAATTPNVNILAQQTRLMRDATAAGLSQREVKTEVFKPNVSELTSIKAAATAAPKNRRRLSVAVGALAVLIGGSAVGGGIYVMNPSIFGPSDPEPANLPGTSADVWTIANANSQTESNTNTELLLTQTNSSTQITEPSKKESQPQDNKPKTDATQKDGAPETGLTLVDQDGSTVQMPAAGKKGNIIITEKYNGGESTVILRNSPPSPNVQPPANVPLTPGFDPRNLTPEQRRRLRNAIRNGQVPPMRPTSTPLPKKP